MSTNPLIACDFYKVSHKEQYPRGTEVIYSNLTARSAQHAHMPATFDNKVVFFGLQRFVMRFLIEAWNREFFRMPKEQVVAAYKRRMDTALGPGAVDTAHIEALHDLGYLPLLIKALPEGSRVNLRVPMLTLRNTASEFYWLTNYIETALSAELWKPITAATIAYEYRRQLNEFVQLTGSPKEFADWQNHDFSMRGMSGVDDAANCGIGHLLSSYGTDTIVAIEEAEKYYGANAELELIGGSVPASEHSVMCAGGDDGEIETFRRMINELYPTGIVSIVSDTWDFWHVITTMAAQLKPEIMARQPNALGQAKVVFRPDSGDPVKIICGYKWRQLDSALDLENRTIVYDMLEDEIEVVRIGGTYHILECAYWPDGSLSDVWPGDEISEAQAKGAVQCLWEIFGGTTTDKGYRTLDQHVGLIYGDSITLERQREILQRLADNGFSAANIVFGVGSYTYQHVTRDTFGMAVKATWAQVNGEARELFKDPVTDNGVKKSAKGLLRVESEGGELVLHDQCSAWDEKQGLLEPVFRDGAILRHQTLGGIRARLGALGS